MTTANATGSATNAIDCATLRSWLRDGDEIALLDVREHGQYGEGHPFFAAPLPYSRLELEIERLVPCRDTRVVLVDEDDGVSSRAARRLQALGYTRVHVLAGGAKAWSAAGHTLFAGVNVPSKAFGELVGEHYRTPRVSAAELVGLRERGERVVVLDGRPFAEYRKMNIPGSICCPNGELAYRIGDLVDGDETTIVVNCAGRTRSIVGAQTLVEAGVPNRVLALENGTQGWYLNDLALEHGSTHRYPDNASPRGAQAANERAMRLCARVGVESVAPDTVRSWLRESARRSTYLCDVRSPEEFAARTLPGAQHTPGGQLVQAFDQYVGVRHARLVLFDSDGVRARTTASWLRRMGHEAFVLEGGLQAGLEAGLDARRPAYSPAPLERVDANTLTRWIESDEALVVDLRSSASYRSVHLEGALWGIRPHLVGLVRQRIGRRKIVLVSDEPTMAAIAAIDLREADLADPLFFDFAADNSGIDPRLIARNTATPPDAERIDFLFFVHDRHEGNKEAARQYLAWETNLLSQLDDDEKGSFLLPEGH